MIQAAFIDMENMFDLLSEEVEVSVTMFPITICIFSNAKSGSSSCGQFSLHENDSVHVCSKSDRDRLFLFNVRLIQLQDT